MTLYIVNGTPYRKAGAQHHMCSNCYHEWITLDGDRNEPCPICGAKKRDPRGRSRDVEPRLERRRQRDSFRAFDRTKERSVFRSKRGRGGLITEAELHERAVAAFTEDNGRPPADHDELERWATTVLNALARHQRQAGPPLIDPGDMARGTKFGNRGDQGKREDREDRYRRHRGVSEGRNPKRKRRPLKNPRQIAWGNGTRGRGSKYTPSKDESWTKSACQKRWEDLVGDAKDEFAACERAVAAWAKDPGGYCAHLEDCRKGSQTWRKGPRD